MEKGQQKDLVFWDKDFSFTGFSSLQSPNRLDHKELDKAKRKNKLMKDSSSTFPS